MVAKYIRNLGHGDSLYLVRMDQGNRIIGHTPLTGTSILANERAMVEASQGAASVIVVRFNSNGEHAISPVDEQQTGDFEFYVAVRNDIRVLDLVIVSARGHKSLLSTGRFARTYRNGAEPGGC
ncbi:MAG: JAB domain-containing protein [Verrucomicrobiota bacterium]